MLLTGPGGLHSFQIFGCWLLHIWTDVSSNFNRLFETLNNLIFHSSANGPKWAKWILLQTPRRSRSRTFFRGWCKFPVKYMHLSDFISSALNLSAFHASSGWFTKWLYSYLLPFSHFSLNLSNTKILTPKLLPQNLVQGAKKPPSSMAPLRHRLRHQTQSRPRGTPQKPRIVAPCLIENKYSLD